MITVVSLAALLGGVALVASAPRDPAHGDLREWLGGLLVVTGLLALGVALVLTGA